MGFTSLKKKKPKRQIQETLYPPPPTTAASRRWRRRAAVPAAAALLLLLYFTWWNFEPRIHPRFYTFDIVNEFPHDPNAFTQGLLYGGNDTLFESTGLYHRSSVRHVHLQTGKVLLHHQMDGSLFGEGLTLLGERLLQVTWLEKTGFVYDRFNFSKTDCIARIAHDNGNVLGWIFLHELRQGLLRAGYTGIDVLNGIAWDEENNRLFVTGKLWPKLYEIKLRPVRGPINGRVDELCPRGYY